MLTVGSLFSGAGICDLGLAWAGFTHRWFCEIDPFCQSILARHWPDIPIYENVTALKGSDASGCSLLPTPPHRDDRGQKCRLLSPLQGFVEKFHHPVGLSDWCGIRFDWTRKKAALEAYRESVLYRVDDGSAEGLDDAGRPKPARALETVTPPTAREWIPRLKALGNAITPQQSYAIGACIMEREGMRVSPMPLNF